MALESSRKRRERERDLSTTTEGGREGLDDEAGGGRSGAVPGVLLAAREELHLPPAARLAQLLRLVVEVAQPAGSRKRKKTTRKLSLEDRFPQDTHTRLASLLSTTNQQQFLDGIDVTNMN